MKENHPDKRYLELAEKWLNGSITPEEELEYAQWYNSLPLDEALEVPAHRALTMEEHRQKIFQQINQKRSRVITLRPKSIYKVAAAILLLLSAGAYLFVHKRTARESKTVINTAIVKERDIKPGTTGAILTLSNGQTIVLDTARNGSLLNSSKTSIVKLDGSVAFSGPSNAARPAHEYNLLVTPRAHEQQLVLCDGTKVWLNAESSIKFPTAFDGHQRIVDITGEAYFEVAKDSLKPFVVRVNDAAIEVLGTHFNIMAYGNEPALETTLLEGAVKFKKGRATMLLKPGQQSRLLSNDDLKLVPDADVDAAVAWKNGVQAFNNADIKAVMRQVERWYNVDVELIGNIPVRTFSGEIPRSANLSELLRLLEVVKIHFSVDPDKRRLTVMP